jgi:flagella basal body P-ring formation protein FlgA
MNRARFSFLLVSVLLFAAGAVSRAGAQSEAARPGNVPPGDATPIVLDEAMLTDLARQIADHFHLAGELQLDLVRAWALPSIPAGTSPRLVIAEFTSAPASSMLVRCRLEAGGAPLSPCSIAVHAQLWADAWVAREPLDAGQVFDPAQLELRRSDRLREREALPASVSDRDYVLARNVPAGRTLVWRDLTRRPLVRKGETVEVCAVEGSLTVTLKALATQNGGRGDTVLVRNQDSKREFTAVVVDENRVQVRF